MNRLAWLLLLASSSAFADRYFIDQFEGTSGGVPAAALLLGVLGAVLFSYVARDRRGGLTHIAGTVFVGFWIGVLLGLPVACAIR